MANFGCKTQRAYIRTWRGLVDINNGSGTGVNYRGHFRDPLAFLVRQTRGVCRLLWCCVHNHESSGHIQVSFPRTLGWSSKWCLWTELDIFKMSGLQHQGLSYTINLGQILMQIVLLCRRHHRPVAPDIVEPCGTVDPVLGPPSGYNQRPPCGSLILDI